MKLTKDQFKLGLKGFAMGMADIVPGVSGGTVALITGVYDDLIQSISSVNKEFVQALTKFQIMKCLELINYKFLFPLFFGILAALVSMAKLMHFLMAEYSVYTWSLFFGLILASILFLVKSVDNIKNPKNIGLIAIGTAVGYGIISLIPVQTPDTLLAVFLSGCISICAMILPGISGSFILLILGKYLYITSALKNLGGDGSLYIIAAFASGCFIGLVSFSKVLNYLLKNFHNAMMCVLTGFMIGSMKKIWPWREVIEQKIVRGKVHVLQDAVVFPTINTESIFAFIIMIIGISLVIILEKSTNKA